MDDSDDSSDDGEDMDDSDDADDDNSDDDSSDDDMDDLDGALDDLNALGPCMDAAIAWASIALAPLTLMSPDVTEEQIEELNATIEEMEADIPEEIADDLLVIQEAFAEYAEAFDADGTLDLQALEAMGEMMESDEYVEASENVDAWFTENCG
jgi:hypothetical protein